MASKQRRRDEVAWGRTSIPEMPVQLGSDATHRVWLFPVGHPVYVDWLARGFAAPGSCGGCDAAEC